MGAVPFLCMENMDVTTALVNRLRELWHDELDDARAAGDRAAVVRISKALKELPDPNRDRSATALYRTRTPRRKT